MSLNLNLNLRKPLVFLKVATTGNDPVDKREKHGDRIVEISITRIESDRQTIKTGTRLVNPGFEIPIEATAINGITNEMVANMPKFSDIAQGLYSFIGDSDFAGFNIRNFDLKFLVEEFNRAGIPFSIYDRKIIDLSYIFNKMESRDFKSAALKFADRELSSDPISSETANNISLHILNGMVANYASNPNFGQPNPDSINEIFNKNKRAVDVNNKILLNNDKKPIFAFGKYEGLVISEIFKSDPQYIDWCVTASDLPLETKYILKRIIEKVSKI